MTNAVLTPELNLYDQDWPIWTSQEQLPPAKFIFDEDDRRGMAVDSMVSGGCIISGAYVHHSLLFSNVTVDEHSEIDSAVVLPDVTIGKNCKICHAVIDKGCHIKDGTIIGENKEVRILFQPADILLEFLPLFRKFVGKCPGVELSF